MKKNWMKKLSAALCAATLFASGLAVNVNATNETITAFNEEDFVEMTGLTDTVGHLTVKKYMAVPASTTEITANDKPVNGVEITIKQVGEYATVVDSNGTASVLMGISDTLLTTVGKVFEGAPKKDGYTYLTSAQYDEVNTALQTIDVSKFNTDTYYTQNITKQKTGEGQNDQPGTTTFTINDENYGIYLVRETSVADAVADINGDNIIDPVVKDDNGANISGEFVAFKKKQYPYLVSIPASIKETVKQNGQDVVVDKWTVNVDAKAKNDEVEVDIDKFIERNNTNKTFGSIADQKKNDVTHVGDTVEFTLKSDIPMVDSKQSTDTITSYEIHDVISNGITLPAKFDKTNIKVMLSGTQELTLGTDASDPNVDYVISSGDITTDTSSPALNNASYAYGQQFVITFTPAGREKLTVVAKDTTEGADARRFVRVSYTATVNSEAIVGTAGNPNKVKLEYASAGSSEITTEFHEVKEFIFSMEGNKTFDSTQNDGLADENVKFELYLDNPEINKDATALRLIQNDVGDYTYVDPASIDDLPEGTKIVDKISLNKSSFSIKGVPVTLENAGVDVTLYLKETATAPGYNKLTKVIPITLTAKAEGTPSEYDGTLASGTVNKKAVEPIKVDGEGVAVAAGETGGTNSGISFTVNNTKGFQLPSTGGMGIWMFVIGGMAVIGCGLLYYRRNKSAE